MARPGTFVKGQKKPNQGKRGPDKIGRDVKEMVVVALHHAGGAEYLFMQAFDNPKAFLSLVARVLPLQVNGAGANGEHVFERIVREIVEPK